MLKPAQIRSSRGFTLVEVMVAMVILMLIVVTALSILKQTTLTWRHTQEKIEQFRMARDGFETITRHLSQATLNTYCDYLDADGRPRTNENSGLFIPYRYGRQSELRFISGPGLIENSSYPTHAVFFQAPTGIVSDVDSYGGMESLLNTWGFYIEFGIEHQWPAFIADRIKQPRYRFRLVELMLPSESTSIYAQTSGNPAYNGHDWFAEALNPDSRSTHVVAENIIALVLLPKLTPQADPTGAALAPKYSYDSTVSNSNPLLNSKNQLPPIIQVTMVAVDETSFNRFQSGSAMPDLGLDRLFLSADRYSEDLRTLEDTLKAKRLNYRIFSTEVSIATARWSADESN